MKKAKLLLAIIGLSMLTFHCIAQNSITNNPIKIGELLVARSDFKMQMKWADSRKACEKLKEQGARRALVLPVGGAFHSPLMEEAKQELKNAISNTTFSNPICPIYQNVTSFAVSDQMKIKENLIAQLTSPVKWTQSIQKMVTDGATNFIELGPGKVLQGLARKINGNVEASSLSS